MNTKIISIGLIALSLFSCSDKKTQTESNDSKPIKVKISNQTTVENSSNNSFSVSGKLESSQTANLSAKVMGQILAVNVKEGQKVSAGQTLLVIKSDDLISQKAQANASIQEATAAYTNAKINYDRFLELYNQQSATKFELDNAKMQLDMAKSRVNQAQSAENQMNAIISESIVKAPFSGTVTKKFVETGSMASPGMPLLSVENTEDLVAKILVPESEIQNISVGQTVEVIISSINEKVNGKVSLINASSQFTGSLYEVEIKINQTSELKKKTKSGMFIKVSFPRKFESKITEKSSQNVIVPKSAIVENGQLKGIYTISEDKAILRWVKTGKDFGDQIEILSGLTENEKYVLSSESKLYNGAKIIIE